MSSEPTIKVDYDGYWWNWAVELDKRDLMGCDRTLQGALEAVLEASDKIKETPRNTRRNP
jgi:hypothetical protein